MPAPTDPLLTLALAGAVFGVLSAAWPRAALALLLGSLPLFLHQAQSPWFLRLVVLVTGFELGYAARHVGHWRHAWAAATGHPLLFRAGLFVAVAFLSLSSLPLAGIVRQHWAVLAHHAGGDPVRYLVGLLTLPEVTREYSVVAAFLTLQAFVLAVIVARETRREERTGVLLAGAIAAGLAVSVGLGLAELFEVVDLQAMRGHAGVEWRVGTLQAGAGNPAWFVEYLVYALPYSLFLLAGREAPRRRLLAFAALLGIATLGLVLGFQRGGWMAGLIVLLYLVAATAHVLAGEGPGRRPLRAVVPRLLLGLGLVAALAVTVTYLWTGRAEAARDEEGGITRHAFLVRLTSVFESDRVRYWQAGVMIGRLHPLLGGGVDSFGYRYRSYFLEPGGVYDEQALRLVYPTSAHSLYGQVLSGTGVLGLLVLLAVLYGGLASGVLGSLGPTASRPRMVVLLAGVGSLLGIVVYGLVQEIFYVHALRVLFFVNLGLIAGLAPPRATSPTSRHLAAAGLAVALALHLLYEYRYPGRLRLVSTTEPAGFFGQEADPAGRAYRWSTEWATLPMRAKGGGYSLEVRSVAPFPQEVEVTACGKERTVALRDQSWKLVAGQASCPGGVVELEVTPAWRPPGDARLLGVMVSSAELR